MKKILLTAFVLSIFTFGCDKCPPNDPYFDIEGVEMLYTFKGESTGNSGFNPLADSMKFDNFRLQFGYKVRFYSVNPPKPFSLVPAAYALDCVMDGEGGTKEKMTDIQLIALSDYNSAHLKGTSLNSIITINNLSVSKFIEEQNQFGISSYGSQIELSEKPDPTVKQAFKLILKLDTGEIYETETKPVTLY